MIARYQRPEMSELWTPLARAHALLDVELAVARAQAQYKIIPEKAVRDMVSKARIDLKRIDAIEKVTRHDVIAFVSQVAESIGPSGRFLHFGMTSSDVLDTASSLMIQRAGSLLISGFTQLERALLKKARENVSTMVAGRTHGMHAEPTSYGYVLLGHLEEFKRAHERIERALMNNAIVKLSGAVGTYSAQDPRIEENVGARLHLYPEAVATQVVPRDRLAELFCAFGLWASTLERLAVDLRHRQRTEVGEVEEGFASGQKGSSAMPHKKNPISAENLTGLARVIRSYVVPALENVALWHERDISHSSVERIVLPDAFMLVDYACHRLVRLVNELVIKKERMTENMTLSSGQMMSSHLLLMFVEKGFSREEAYARVQSLSHGLKHGEHLKDVIGGDRETTKLLGSRELKELFSGKRHLRVVTKRMGKMISDHDRRLLKREKAFEKQNERILAATRPTGRTASKQNKRKAK